MKLNFKIYIVHYKKLIDRKKIIEKSLISSGMSYYFESDYDRANLDPKDKKKFSANIADSYKANFLSHIKCYDLLRTSGEDYALILEDDSVPGELFYENIENYLKKLLKDFGLFFVSEGKNKFKIPRYLRRPFKKFTKKTVNLFRGEGPVPLEMQMLILYPRNMQKYCLMNSIVKIFLSKQL